MRLSKEQRAYLYVVVEVNTKLTLGLRAAWRTSSRRWLLLYEIPPSLLRSDHNPILHTPDAIQRRADIQGKVRVALAIVR